MLRMMKIVMIGFIAGSFLATGAYANDKGASGTDREKKHEEMFDKMTKELDLTADQQAKLKANKEAQHAEKEALHEAMKANRAKFKEAIAKPGATKADIEPIAAEMKSLQAQMVDQRVDSILAVKAILTPDQFTKMQKKFEEKKEKRGEHGAKKWHDED
jgi:Spy/CpxP family protein refolding chaperone